TPVGPAVDVHALGAILYELLTGRPPFEGVSAMEVVLQVMKDEPVPPRRLVPTVPRDLDTICLKCLEKAPARRYASARALAEDLERFRQGRPILARPTSAWEKVVKAARRHPKTTALLVCTALGLVLGVVLLSWQLWRVEQARGVAQDARALAEAREARLA